MPDGLCAVVLSAGEGVRLRPLTATLPKPLLPVGNVALLDRALDRLAEHGLAGPESVAVNTWYLADAVAAHVGDRAYVSREPGPSALGTSGALAHLSEWIAGRAVLVLNSDAFLSGSGRDLAPLVEGWDPQTVRLLTVAPGDRPAEFSGRRFAGASLLPADLVAGLPSGRSDLVLTIWRPAERAGRLHLVAYDGQYLDTGTPADYLAANLLCLPPQNASLVAASAVVDGTATASVVGPEAVILGSVTRCVVLPGGFVDAGESLVGAVRLGASVTVPGR